MEHVSRNLPALALVIAAALCACGDGNDTPPEEPQGSLRISDVDIDDDGLIEIATLEQLDWVRNNLSGSSLTDHDGRVNSRGCLPGGCNGYELVADLDFDTIGNGRAWVPIGGDRSLGSSAAPFSANFDGNGHTISNLHANNILFQEDSIGLFGHVESTTGAPIAIRNIVITDSSAGGTTSIAILIGRAVTTGPVFIENNKVSGTIRLTGRPSRDVGGLIGQAVIADGQLTVRGNESSVVPGEFADAAGSLIGSVRATGASRGSVMIADNTASGRFYPGFIAGGLIGEISATVPVVVENCSSSVDMQAFGGLSALNGGLIGEVSGSDIRISRSQATGSVQGEMSGGASGGLIGVLRSSGTITIEDSMSSSIVSFIGEGVVAGGLIGSVSLDGGRVDIHGTFSEGSVSVPGPAGGLIGSIRGGSDSHLALSSSYSASRVGGSENVGGLVGEIDVSGNTSIVMENFFSITRVSARGLAGGVIGQTRAADTASVTVSNGYVVNTVTADNDVGALGGIVAGPVNFRNLYWATDTTTQLEGFGGIAPPASTEAVHGSTLAGLSCPTGPDDVSCDANELYHGWGEALNPGGEPAWRFSNPGALPALRIGGSIHQPAQNNSGDFFVVRE